MTWTTPRTWETNELVTAELMNEQLRDNLVTLKDMPADLVLNAGGYSTTSTTFVEVNAVFNRTLATNGGRLLIGLNGFAGQTTTTAIEGYFDFEIDSVSESSSNGVYRLQTQSQQGLSFGFVWLTEPKDAGSHTIKLKYRRGGASANPFQIYSTNMWIKEV